MAQKFLSIIVPVYNVEKYLKECVESMICAQMDQMEIILVNDGSKDSSGKICDELSARYACVHCVHKENEGVSRARNDGLRAAQGRYVAFVDADDRLAEGSIPAVLRWTAGADADICFMQALKFYPDSAQIGFGDGITSDGVRGRERTEVFRYLSTRPKYPGSSCTKLFRRDFLTENKLVFPAGRSNGEDFSFVMSCMLAAERFDALDMPYYEYRQERADSASYAVTEKIFWQMSLFVNEFSDRLTQNGKAVDEIAGCAMSFIAYEYLVLLMGYESLRRKRSGEIKAMRAYLREKRWVMKYARSRVGMLGFGCMRIAGFDLTAWIIGIVKGKQMKVRS